VALTDTTTAIGAVSELLKNRLASGSGIGTVLIGRPESARGGSGNRFNLFLYRVSFDGHMRNVPLDNGQAPPLWVVLHYLLTAFDDGDDSDSKAAHELLGRGVVALQELNFIAPAATDVALFSNPEPLKLTFDEADADLLSKIMQGPDEKYRLSAAFQIRPVMLAVQGAPEYAPLVQTIGPPGAQGVVVLPSLGPQLLSADPERFQAGQQLELLGTDLAGYDEILIGTTSFPSTPTARGGRATTVPLGNPIAAGAYPVCVARTLASGHKRTSNAVLGRLAPIVIGAAKIAPLHATGTLRDGSFRVTGSQLGGPNASAFAALYRDGAAKLLLEPQPGGTATLLTFTVSLKQALEKGDYTVIVRVNGEQATASPVLDWT